VPVMVVADEFWIDLHGWLPAWPSIISTGLIPLLTVLAVFAGVYTIARKGLRANQSEALMGLFTFIITSLIVLTVIGNLFRGPNMALRLPF
jgi:predicted anti-sigma-YlaC factor YlaD